MASLKKETVESHKNMRTISVLIEESEVFPNEELASSWAKEKYQDKSKYEVDFKWVYLWNVKVGTRAFIFERT